MASTHDNAKIKVSLTGTPDTGSHLFATLNGITDITMPTISKDAIDITNYNDSSRSFTGGLIEHGQLQFTSTHYQTSSLIHGEPKSASHIAHPIGSVDLNDHIHIEVPINGDFSTVHSGGIQDSVTNKFTGWTTDNGGGTTISNGVMTVDLATDGSDPAYIRRNHTNDTTITGSKRFAEAGTIGVLQYEITQNTNAGEFRLEFGSATSDPQYAYATLNDHRSVGVHKVAFANQGAKSDGTVRSGIILYLRAGLLKMKNFKYFQIFDFVECMRSNKTLHLKIEGIDSDVTFQGFITNVETETPVDGVIKQTVTVQCKSGITYA